MSAIAFGVPMQFDKAYAEGITQLTREDIRYAEQLGYRIKLLGITRRARNGIELRVHPTLIPARRLIANVEGAMNAVLVKGDAVGSTLYYGAGAGAEPTASAVIADLVDVTRMHTADPEHRVPHLAFQPDQLTDVPFLPIGDVETSYYLRMRVLDRPGVLADITRILADREISIDAMIQKEPTEGEDQTDIILLTHKSIEHRVVDAIARIESLPTVRGTSCASASRTSAEHALREGSARRNRANGRSDELRQHARRVARRAAAVFARSCSKAWRPTAASRCPKRIRDFAPDELARLRPMAYADLAFAILSRFIGDIPPGDLRADRRSARTPPQTFGSDDITPLADARAGPASAAPVERADARVQGHRAATARQPVRVRAARRRSRAQHPRRDVGRHRQLGRVRDARQARHRACSCCRRAAG